MLIRRLYKEVLVPLTVGRIPLVGQSSDNGSWQSALRVVIVDVCRQTFIECGSLNTVECNIRVVPGASSILLFLMEAETVVAFGMLVFGVNKEQILQGKVSL